VIATERSPSTAELFLSAAVVLGDHDPLDSVLHRSVRDRGLRDRRGRTSRARRHRPRHHRPAAAPPRRPDADPAGAVLTELSLRLDHCLETRLVELAVHLDDLAVSTGTPTPQLPEDAQLLVVRILAETAARRTGGLAAVRAPARRERHPEALRAL
jgi:hypothetical protein